MIIHLVLPRGVARGAVLGEYIIYPRWTGVGNLESNIPLFVNHRQVNPQGLWDSHVMKPGLISLKICIIHFAP